MRKEASECVCRSMNPGVTAFPVASIHDAALASDKSPIATIASPLMPTSATYGSEPLPS